MIEKGELGEPLMGTRLAVLAGLWGTPVTPCARGLAGTVADCCPSVTKDPWGWGSNQSLFLHDQRLRGAATSSMFANGQSPRG